MTSRDAQCPVSRPKGCIVFHAQTDIFIEGGWGVRCLFCLLLPGSGQACG